ncbi:pyridoxal phosphate-dependent aminotransferase [Natrialba magadii ATCC 43099]|uniref:Class III aminotransferase n=1 Tax=Natrialba magadii (strain ATCC 43099 / DSM 3394 / CCM 3739 / CIP 104546 / IAM 13178 / JCM 8861 / NBRC 102185 / NCIMB 2190 / MS3) TaxID=547559 RepID=D3T036_NATMM|nr:aminotransferase class III-fold pyridoxal phosphate-dependent enzyme [Natrialba magadii]ADD04394.1 pyridoxal phosphate-dependent aminotransferase [Natrialba magadii ATCC 43099]ELY25790.1 class III aminotransferase [Natrialba magadii ATCC 43099]
MRRETAEPSVSQLPGPAAAEWVEYHQQAAATSTYVYDFVWDITADAEGPFCTDPDGNVLLDFTSHVAAAPLGYNNPLLMEKFEEFDLVDPLKIAGHDFYVSTGGSPEDAALPGPSHLINTLADITDHYDMDTVFLSNSGAEAVENAIKLCYDNCAEPKYGLTFEGAFHGRTLGALSLNRSKSVHRRDFPEISGIHDVPPSMGGIERLREKLDPKSGHIPSEQVAFLILEPVQGEGGYRVPDDEFMREVSALCTEHDIPLIADEIQTGVGRTGEMWASDHYEFEPDVITSAKALRVGATISREDLFPDEEGRLSSTWGAGDIIASMQGTLTLAAIEEHDLVSHAAEQGTLLVDLLTDVKESHEDVVNDVRGLGLMGAIEFDTAERRDEVVEAALQRGLLTLGCGKKTLRLLPPLDVRDRELEIAIDLLEDSIAAVEPATVAN